MKGLLLIFAMVAGISSGQAQNPTKQIFDLNLESISLEESLTILERKHDLLFSYALADLDSKVVSCRYQGKNVDKLLTQLLQGTGLGYEIVDESYILISPVELTVICGRIIDELGEPLVGATVLVDNSAVGCATGLEGNFELKHNFVKGQDISISYIGYETKLVDYRSLSKGNCPDLVLEHPKELNPWLIITAYMTDAIRLDESGGATILQTDKLTALPGQVEPDVLKSIQLLPGISSPSSKTSDIFIRGGTPDQNLILWEDIPIYHSAHYFGTISAFDPYTTKDVKVYRGGFGAEYGGRVSGIIDIKALDTNSSGAKFRTGMTMSHGYVGGLIKNKGNSSALSYSLRRSYTELFTTPTVRNITRFNQQGYILNNKELSVLPDNIKVRDDFSFIDSHLKFTKEIGTKDKVELSTVYTDNTFNDVITDSNRKQEQLDSLSLNNRGLSVKWQHAWSGQSTTTVKAIATTYDFFYDYKLEEQNQLKPRIFGFKENKITDTQFSLANAFKLTQQSSLAVGYHWTKYDIQYKLINEVPGRLDVDERDISNSALHTLFASYDKPLSKQVFINLGLRSTYFERTSKIYTAPRLRMTYKPSQKISLGLNYGRYFQFVGQVTEIDGNDSGISFPVWALAMDQSIPIQQADMVQLGGIYRHKGWLVDIQAYTKKVDGLSSKSYDLDGVEPGRPEIGYSSSKGIDVLINKRFKNFQSWLSYTYSSSTLNFRKIAKTSFPTDYDQRHSAQWTGLLKLNNWDLSLGFKIGSGLPYSVIQDFKVTSSPMGPVQYNTIYNGINNYNLPYTKEVNLSVQYALPTPGQKWKTFIGLSVTNLLNADNIYERTYYIDSRQNVAPSISIQNKRNLMRTANLSLRVEW